MRVSSWTGRGCGEFRGDGFPHDERASFAETFDASGLRPGEFFWGECGAGFGHEAIDVNDVFDTDRDTVEARARARVGMEISEGVEFVGKAGFSVGFWKERLEIRVDRVESFKEIVIVIFEAVLSGAKCESRISKRSCMNRHTRWC
jgi:hypothetical protein